MKLTDYFVVNLQDVIIEEDHQYTLIFKGYIETYGDKNKLYTFKYDGNIDCIDGCIPDGVKTDFEDQLRKDYEFGFKFNLNEVKAQLERKSQYRMKIM